MWWFYYHAGFQALLWHANVQHNCSKLPPKPKCWDFWNLGPYLMLMSAAGFFERWWWTFYMIAQVHAANCKPTRPQKAYIYIHYIHVFTHFIWITSWRVCKPIHSKYLHSTCFALAALFQHIFHHRHGDHHGAAGTTKGLGGYGRLQPGASS